MTTSSVSFAAVGHGERNRMARTVPARSGRSMKASVSKRRSSLERQAVILGGEAGCREERMGKIVSLCAARSPAFWRTRLPHTDQTASPDAGLRTGNDVLDVEGRPLERLVVKLSTPVTRRAGLQNRT